MNNSISKIVKFKNMFSLLKIKILLNKNPNNIELGRWCSSKMINNDY